MGRGGGAGNNLETPDVGEGAACSEPVCAAVGVWKAGWWLLGDHDGVTT